MSLVVVPTAVVASYFTRGPSSTTTIAAVTLETKDDVLVLDTKAMKSLLEEDDDDDRILQATHAMRLELRALRQRTISKHAAVLK